MQFLNLEKCRSKKNDRRKYRTNRLFLSEWTYWNCIWPHAFFEASIYFLKKTIVKKRNGRRLLVKEVSLALELGRKNKLNINKMNVCFYILACLLYLIVLSQVMRCNITCKVMDFSNKSAVWCGTWFPIATSTVCLQSVFWKNKAGILVWKWTFLAIKPTLISKHIHQLYIYICVYLYP